MREEREMKTAIVKAKDMGANCWSAARFVEGERCPRVMECKYPEKKTCKAVVIEIAYLQQERNKFLENLHGKMAQLVREKTVGVGE